MQTYPWFDQVPDHLKTRRQLAAQGLRPGGPVIAQVVWRRGKAHADLYDQNAAKPKRAMTEAQRAALASAQQARRTCPGCQTLFPFVLGAHVDCPVCFERMLARDRDEAIRQARVWLHSPRTIILDTETTDLDGYLVQIAAIDTTGQVVLDTLVNPRAPISAGARRVHGMSDDQVADAPTFEQIADDLLVLLRGRRIVTYNADFDSGILQNELARLAGGFARGWDAARAVMRQQHWRCAMTLYAAYVGEYSDYHGSYRWQPLAGGDHTALGDCRACLETLRRMAED